jgi:predicted phage-related endonuclease
MRIGTVRRLGATDAAKLLNVSKYGDALDVYRRVVEGRTTKPNAQMARGTREEPRVLRMYVEATGAELQQFVMPVICEHPDHPFATSSPDAVTVDGVLVELKTASLWAKGWHDGPPIDYVLQVAWSLWVTGLKRAHLFCAFGSDVRGDVPSFAIERTQLWSFSRDAELESEFAEVGGRFWREHVEKCIPPFSNAAPTAAPTNEANQ